MKGFDQLRELGRDLRPPQAQREGPHGAGVRTDRGVKEPWTWVRTHGKGRVFYTAWGHDHRTWSHPGFHNLRRARHPLGVRAGPGAGRAVRRPAEDDGSSQRTRSRSSSSRRSCRSTRPASGGARPASRSRKMQKPLPAARSRSSTTSTPEGFELQAVRDRGEARRRQADRHDLGRTRPAVAGGDAATTPTRCSPRARAATRSSSARTPTATAGCDKVTDVRGQAEHPDEPACTPTAGVIVHAGPAHAVPEGHRRRRQGGRAAGAVHRLGHRRHARRAEQPAVRVRQLDLRHASGTAGFVGR